MATAKKAAPKKAAPKKSVAPVRKVQARTPKENKLTVEFSPEFLAILDNGFRALAAAINKLSAVEKVQGPAAAAVQATIPFVEQKTTQPVTTAAPVVTAQPANTVLTRIRELVVSKQEGGKTSAIVKLLGEYGAKNMSSLPEEHYEEFLTKLEAL